MNEIHIKSLAVSCHIGVPEEERRSAQNLEIDVTMTPAMPFDALNDTITHTADYDTAARRITAVCQSHPRQLIETLAIEIVETLLAEFPLTTAEVEIRKFILPDTRHVAVRCRRQQPSENK